MRMNLIRVWALGPLLLVDAFLGCEQAASKSLASVPASSSQAPPLPPSPYSGPLHPAAATHLLPSLFALQPGGDAELGPLPEPVDFSGEVFGELGGVKYQQGFVVLMGGAGAPVEGAGDHGAVVDHGQFVVELVAAGQPWCAHTL